MLACDLIDPAFKRLAKAEVVSVERKYLATEDGIVHPLGQRNRDADHPSAIRLPDDLPAVDQAETSCDFFVSGLNIGGDRCAAQAFKGFLETTIAVAAGLAVGGDQEVKGLDVQRARGCRAIVHAGDQLADAVDQDVLIVNGRQALHARRDFDLGVAVCVLEHPRVRTR